MESSAVMGTDWLWEGRKVGNEPRNALSQRDRLGETSKSLEAREAIWTRRDCALGRGGRREIRVEEALDCFDSLDCCEVGFGGLGT